MYRTGGGFNPKGRVRELLSPPQQGALAGKGLRVGLLSHRAAAHFPWGRGGQFRAPALARGRSSPAGVVEVEKAAPWQWPPGALARAGHSRQMAPASPFSARLPASPSPGPTPSTAPARGRRESGAAAVVVAAAAAAAAGATWASCTSTAPRATRISSSMGATATEGSFSPPCATPSSPGIWSASTSAISWARGANRRW